MLADEPTGNLDSKTGVEIMSLFERLHESVSYTHLRAHETVLDIVCRLLLENTTRQRNSHKYKAIYTIPQIELSTHERPVSLKLR